MRRGSHKEGRLVGAHALPFYVISLLYEHTPTKALVSLQYWPIR